MFSAGFRNRQAHSEGEVRLEAQDRATATSRLLRPEPPTCESADLQEADLGSVRDQIPALTDPVV